MNLSLLHRTTFLPLTLSVLGGISVVTASASDWAQWRGPNRDGISTEKNISLQWPTSGPKTLWKASTGVSYSAVTVQGDRVYTMGGTDLKDTVYCFDAETGKPLWTYSYEHPKRVYQGDPTPIATTSTPTLDGDHVYVLSREGRAICLDAKDGKVLWQKNLRLESQADLPPWGFSGSPLVEGEKVFYNVGHHGIAMQKTTGEVLWKSMGGMAGYATPVSYKLGSQKGIAFFNGSGLVGVNAETGIPYWEHKWKTQFGVNATDPVFFDDGFFISAAGRAQRVQVADNKPTVAAEIKNMQNSFINPVLIDGHFYGNNKGRLTCLEIKSDAIKWDIPQMGSGSLIAVGKTLIALSERGELIVVEANPAKLTEITRAKVLDGTCWTQPTLANGRLYCRNVAGDLICLDVKK
jgi:outer membrane protein assembly factor BamB